MKVSDILVHKTTTLSSGVYDRRPSNVEGLLKAQTSAFFLDKVSNITIRNSGVTWGSHLPDYFSHVLESNGVTGLKMINLEGESAFPAKVQAIKKQ